MRTNTFRLIAMLLVAMVPSLVAAQQNVIKAFDAIINCKDAQVTENHYLQRDPETSTKLGQSDIYTFRLPESKIDLVNNVSKAIKTDSEKAYSVASGDSSARGTDVTLVVGDGYDGNNVVLTFPGCKYIYACFLAPRDDDPDGKYRYAYGMSYAVSGGEITGQLVVTYGMTLKQRQESFRQHTLRDLNRAEIWGTDFGESETWFKEFMKYITAFGYANNNTRPTIAGYLYQVTGEMDKYPEVSESDKATARSILDTLIGDEKNNAPVVQQLLKSSLKNIK